jgi:hypothetical protein
VSTSARAFGVVVAAVVVTAVVAGLFLLGSPTRERERRLDEQRVYDLRATASAIDRYWTINSSLPTSLEALSRERNTSVRLLDPGTGKAYEYRILDGNAYELCAHFTHDTVDERDRVLRDRSLGVSYSAFWTHGAGRHCFRVEPQRLT